MRPKFAHLGALAHAQSGGGVTPPDDSGSVIEFGDGFVDAPTSTLIDGGVTSGGTTTLHGKVKSGATGRMLYDISTPAASFAYAMEYTPDFSALLLQGKLAMIGFGFKTNNNFYIVGLRGDGSTGLELYQVSGQPPNGWNKSTGQTVTAGGAPTYGTQGGPNFIEVQISEDGTSLTFRTSHDGTTWVDELTDISIGPFANASAVTEFGPAAWIDNLDTGEFSVELSLWSTPLSDIILSNDAISSAAAINDLVGTLTASGGVSPYTFEIVSQ